MFVRIANIYGIIEEDALIPNGPNDKTDKEYFS
jgi:hypothetical protein